MAWNTTSDIKVNDTIIIKTDSIIALSMCFALTTIMRKL